MATMVAAETSLTWYTYDMPLAQSASPDNASSSWPDQRRGAIEPDLPGGCARTCCCRPPVLGGFACTSTSMVPRGGRSGPVSVYTSRTWDRAIAH